MTNKNDYTATNNDDNNGIDDSSLFHLLNANEKIHRFILYQA